MASLTPLLELINTGVANLQSVEKKNNTPIPNLSQPFHPSLEAFRSDPVAAEAAAHVVAAALQLVAILAPPVDSLYAFAVAGSLKTAALRVCHESNVSEILREAGTQGLHVKDIAQRNGLEEKKLARFIRYLASSHIYEEVRPDVFRNNRLSSLLDSGKPSADVISSPTTKHDESNGLGALIAHHLDEVTHAAAYTWENMADPKTAHSYESSHCPLATQLGREINLWDYLAEPEQESRRNRFDLAMKGTQSWQPAAAVLEGLDWDKLPEGSTVVDVGGGVGTSMVPLVENFPGLKIVVQDLPQTIQNARQFWAQKNPQAVAEKRVSMEEQSFFDTQPERDVDVFFMKNIIHDWSDPDSKKILTQLRYAAGKDTKLVLAESIIPYTSRTSEQPTDYKNRVPGSVLKQAPAPLLPSFATAPLIMTTDMIMLILVAGQERTFDHMQALLLSTGWKVNEVRHPASEQVMYSFYIASPA